MSAAQQQLELRIEELSKDKEVRTALFMWMQSPVWRHGSILSNFLPNNAPNISFLIPGPGLYTPVCTVMHRSLEAWVASWKGTPRDICKRSWTKFPRVRTSYLVQHVQDIGESVLLMLIAFLCFVLLEESWLTSVWLHIILSMSCRIWLVCKYLDRLWFRSRLELSKGWYDLHLDTSALVI